MVIRWLLYCREILPYAAIGFTHKKQKNDKASKLALAKVSVLNYLSLLVIYAYYRMWIHVQRDCICLCISLQHVNRSIFACHYYVSTHLSLHFTTTCRCMSLLHVNTPVVACHYYMSLLRVNTPVVACHYYMSLLCVNTPVVACHYYVSTHLSLHVITTCQHNLSLTVTYVF